MKALSLWQPWASAIAAGLKKIETRNWPMRYRGRIAIAATKHTPRSELAVFDSLDNHAAAAFAQIGIGTIDDLPRMAIIATCDVIDCVEMTNEFIAGVSGLEKEWGIYHLGRYAIILDNVVRLETPLPIKRGGQRLWNWKEAA